MHIHENGQRSDVSQVVLAVASGSGMDEAIAKAIELAKEHRTSVTALAIVDTKTLYNVGPVPVGGNHYAKQLRNALIAQARTRVAISIETFERLVSRADIPFSVVLEEGDPILYLRERLARGVILIMPRHAWFDHGLATSHIKPLNVVRRQRLGKPEAGTDDNGPIIIYG